MDNLYLNNLKIMEINGYIKSNDKNINIYLHNEFTNTTNFEGNIIKS